MPTTIPTTSLGGAMVPAPGTALQVGNVINAAKLAEKTIELSVCAQYGHLLGTRMVWFGLTQKQERQHGFDTATNLGGTAFILQFKVSATVPRTGLYTGMRRFACQHQQMERLRIVFGQMHNSCFYFLPNIGTFGELVAVSGNLLSNSYMADVADLPAIIPETHRANDYHYAYLDTVTPKLTITSQPFKPKRIQRADTFAESVIKKANRTLTPSERLIDIARGLERTNERIADIFFKNAALAVVL